MKRNAKILKADYQGRSDECHEISNENKITLKFYFVRSFRQKIKWNKFKRTGINCLVCLFRFPLLCFQTL